MRTSSFFLASAFLAAGVSGLMAVGLKSAQDYNPMRSVGHSIAFTIQLPAKVLDAKLGKATVWPVSNSQAKADQLPILDSEAVGDTADYEESTFKRRFAALEK